MTSRQPTATKVFCQTGGASLVEANTENLAAIHGAFYDIDAVRWRVSCKPQLAIWPKEAGMKIAVLVTGYPVFSETFIARELVGLERAGNQLRIAALDRWPSGKSNTVHRAVGAPVEYLSLTSLANLSRLWRAWRRIRKDARWGDVHKLLHEDMRLSGRVTALTALSKALVWYERNREFLPDVIYAHWISRPASVARYASRLTGLSWCCSAHARDVWRADHEVLHSKLEDAEQIVTCNSQAYGMLRAICDRPEKIHLSHHGIDLEQFAISPTSTKMSDFEGPLRILAVGRAVPKKGFDVLLRALAKLPKDIDWQLTHAGGGVGRYRLMWLAWQLGIAQRVRWLGSVPSAQLLDHYRQSDIFVQASTVDQAGDQDGLPNVLVEACSQGLACVTTRLASIQDLVEHEVNGLLVEPGNVRDLAASIARLAHEPSLRQRLGDGAQQSVVSRFDCENSVAFVQSMLEAAATTREESS
jgi:glycosyltransferase involved in cell wall biosynthesis